MPKTITVQQPKFLQRSYLLLDGNKIAGRLDRTGIFRQRVTANIGSREWRFIKQRHLKETITSVVAAGDNEPIAVYHRPVFKQTGSLLLNNIEYRFKVSSWKSRYTWRDKDDNVLVTFDMRGLFKRSGSIEIADSVLKVPGHELLLPLGLYLGIDVEDDNGAAAGATTGSVGAVSGSA